MAMADKIIANARPYLEFGERVDGAFAGQYTIRNELGHGGYRTVVATDRRFLVFRSGSFSQTVAKELIAVAHRGQRLGPVGGLFSTIVVGDQAMKVNRRYYGQIEAINAALGR